MDELKIKSILEETKNATLVVASKYVDSKVIEEMHSFGLNHFGENRVDSFLTKYDELKDLDITWHFIGHLQTNKAKKVINKIDYLHSLDSLDLAEVISKRAVKPLKCFVEVHMTSSETKNGVRLEDLGSFLEKLKKFDKVEVIGLMTMTEKDMSDEEKENVFKRLKQVANQYGLKELSMGMSDDYKLALKEGATYVRLGRIICQ